MGHYRSEMGYEAEDEEREKRRLRRHQKLVEAIKLMIETDGLAETLATIIEDTYEFSGSISDQYYARMERKKNGN